MVSAAVFKAIAAVCLLVIAVLGACGPLVLQRYGKTTAPGQRTLAFVLGNMLSAGVMISAGFVHLLGAAIEELPVSRRHGFPWAPFLCASGFLLTLVADSLATHLSGGHDGGHLCRIPSDGQGAAVRHLVPSGSQSPGPSSSAAQQASLELASGKVEAWRQQPLEAIDNGGRQSGQARKAVADSNGGPAPGEARSLLATAHALAPSDSPVWTEDAPQAKDHPVSEGPGELASVSFVTAVLMAVALCFHSVLEGAATGAQSNVVDTAHIFIAIAAHKGLAAYALGSSLVDSQATPARFWGVIATFAIATPVGIGLGMILATLATGRVAAGVSALASGTFLYVAFMEVIPRELLDPGHQVSKLAMLMLGFAAMSTLAIWA